MHFYYSSLFWNIKASKEEELQRDFELKRDIALQILNVKSLSKKILFGNLYEAIIVSFFCLTESFFRNIWSLSCLPFQSYLPIALSSVKRHCSPSGPFWRSDHCCCRSKRLRTHGKTFKDLILKSKSNTLHTHNGRR